MLPFEAHFSGCRQFYIEGGLVGIGGERDRGIGPGLGFVCGRCATGYRQYRSDGL